MPDGNRGGFSELDIKIEHRNTNFLKITTIITIMGRKKTTHKESFKSKSMGVGGLFGDCQNKPRGNS